MKSETAFTPEVLIPGAAARDVMLLRALGRQAWLPRELDPVTAERLRIQGFAFLKPADETLGTPARWHITAAGVGFLAWESNTEPNLKGVAICVTCGDAHRAVPDCRRAALRASHGASHAESAEKES